MAVHCPLIYSGKRCSRGVSTIPLKKGGSGWKSSVGVGPKNFRHYRAFAPRF